MSVQILTVAPCDRSYLFVYACLFFLHSNKHPIPTSFWHMSVSFVGFACRAAPAFDTTAHSNATRCIFVALTQVRILYRGRERWKYPLFARGIPPRHIDSRHTLIDDLAHEDGDAKQRSVVYIMGHNTRSHPTALDDTGLTVAVVRWAVGVGRGAQPARVNGAEPAQPSQVVSGLHAVHPRAYDVRRAALQTRAVRARAQRVHARTARGVVEAHCCAETP